MAADTERILGQLESSYKSLHDNTERILDGMEQLRKESAQQVQAITQKLDRRSEIVDRSIEGMRRDFRDAQDRVARLEAIADTVEMHGQTLVELEDRQTRSDEAMRTMQTVQATNAKWRTGLAGAAGATAGVIGSTNGAKMLKWLGTFFGPHA